MTFENKKTITAITTSILLASITVLAAQIPNAEATCNGLIDFDTFPNGTAIPAGTRLTDQFASCGVSMFTTEVPEGPEILAFSAFGGSDPNQLAADGPAGNPQLTYSIGVEFVSPVSDASITAIDVSFNGLILEAFNSTNDLVDSVTVIHPILPNQFDIMSVSDPQGDITSLVIRQITPGGQQGLLIDGYVIDDLSFTAGSTSPGQPTGLIATATSSSTIDLVWSTPSNDGGSPIIGYQIERESPIGGGFTTIVADIGSTIPMFEDTGLTSETQYNYRVSAINAMGTGSASNEADATTLPEIIELTLESEKDSFLRQGTPNRNEGANEIMQLRANGNNRALVEFNQADIENTIGTGTLENATLRLYIEDNFNGWGASGRTIDAHTVSENWAEGNAANLGGNIPGTGDGVTWKCAVDTDISDQNKDCATEWGGGNFDGTAIDTLTITNGQEGVYVEFDVTADVQDFLDGTVENNGWIIKKTLEGQSGRLQFTSSDGTANNPELVIFFG